VPVPYYGDESDSSYNENVWRLVVEKKYEAEGYDGWYNNRANPDWGAVGKLPAIAKFLH